MAEERTTFNKVTASVSLKLQGQEIETLDEVQMLLSQQTRDKMCNSDFSEVMEVQLQ